MSSNFTKLVRAPLTHFVVLGVALFLLFYWLKPTALVDTQSKRIEVSPAQIELLSTSFERVWGRTPQATELRKLVDAFIREEIYYREALAIGLDQNDSMVRRRMQQKLLFLHEDLAALDEPREEELEAFYNDNKSNYLESARISVRQVFIREANATGTRVQSLLEKLRAGAKPDQLGDATLLPGQLRETTGERVTATFGDDFATALESVEPGAWSGPIRSSFGLHLVHVDGRSPERVPELGEIRDELRRDLLEQRRANARERIYDSLRSEYMVEILWPAAIANESVAEVP